jgi:hypothetical protein
MREMGEPRYPLQIRQPILIIAAGQDELVSTPAIDEFSVDLRTGAHLIVPGARHDLLMEQDRFRRQALAAFDAFVPATHIERKQMAPPARRGARPGHPIGRQHVCSQTGRPSCPNIGA